MFYPILSRDRSASLWDDMFSLRRSFDRMLDGYLDAPTSTSGVGGWMPKIDVLDRPEAIEVAADLPGLERDDIEVTAENGLLTITGERRSDEQGDETAYRMRERTYGRFERSFTLPASVEADGIAAEYVNGVLRITLPKAERAKPRRVKIQQQKSGWRERIASGEKA